MKLYELKNIENFKKYKESATTGSKSMRSIGLDDLRDILEDNCKVFLGAIKSDQKVNITYRGFKEYTEDFYSLNINDEKYEYKNLYKILFDKILPSWSDFPKFDKSLTTTTNDISDIKYDSIYRVVPYDNAKYGVTANNNIWNSFKMKDRNVQVYLSDFDGFLSAIIRNIFNYETKDVLSNPKLLKSLLKKFDNPEIKDKVRDLKKEFSDRKYVDSYSFYINDYLTNYQNYSGYSYIDFLNERLNPSENMFSVLNYTDATVFPKNREIYIEGNCVLINNKIKLKDLIK